MEKEKLCSLYKSETKVCKHLMVGMDAVWPYVVCRAILGKIPFIRKRHYEWIYMFLIFLSIINRYIRFVI